MLVIIGSCSVDQKKKWCQKIMPSTISVVSSVAWSLLLISCLSFSVCVMLHVCCAGLGWLITWWTARWLQTQRAPVPTKTITKPAWPPMQGSLVSSWLWVTLMDWESVCCKKAMMVVSCVDTDWQIQNYTMYFFLKFHKHNDIKSDV